MSQSSHSKLQDLLAARFSDAPADVPQLENADLLHAMAARGSIRAFQDRPVPMDLLETLSAIALAAPTKSDLQQRDIIALNNSSKRQELAALVGGQAWVAGAPMILVFCGNNRRQRLLHDWHGVAFANDHLDAFFNAAVDAGIALAAFVTAAEATGLGCCPISAVRNEAAAVSKLLDLPDHVFPVAGLAVGYPVAAPQIAMRLPLGATFHTDRYQERDLRQTVDTYDAAREAAQPYQQQRFPETFGTSASYGWSEDKVRQYSQPERQNFGDYVRNIGFLLD